MAGVINLVFNASTQALVGAFGKARKQIKGLNKDLGLTVKHGKVVKTNAKEFADQTKTAERRTNQIQKGMAGVAAAIGLATLAMNKFQAIQDKSVDLAKRLQNENADFASLIALQTTRQGQNEVERRLFANARQFGAATGDVEKGRQLSFLAESAQLSQQNVTQIASTAAVGTDAEPIIRVFRALKQLFPDLTVPEAIGMIQITSGQAIASFGEIAAQATRPLQQGTKAGVARAEIFGALALLTAGGTSAPEAETQATRFFSRVSKLIDQGTIKGGSVIEILNQIKSSPEAMTAIRSEIRAEAAFISLNAPGARTQLEKGAGFTGTPEEQVIAFQRFKTVGARLTGAQQVLNQRQFEADLGTLAFSDQLTAERAGFISEEAAAQRIALSGDAFDIGMQSFTPEFARRAFSDADASSAVRNLRAQQNQALEVVIKNQNLNLSSQSTPTPAGGQ